MKMKTKLILYSVLALIGVPLLILLVRHNDVGYALDSGEATLSITQLESGTQPKTVHLTVTQASLEGGVKFTQRSKKSSKIRYYSALVSRANPTAKTPIVVVSERDPQLTAGNQFSGIWTNGNDGIDSETQRMLEEQGIALADKPMLLNIDKSRSGIIMSLGLWVGGAVLLCSGILAFMIFGVKEPVDPEEAKRREEGVRPLIEQAGFNGRLASILRETFPNPTEPLSLRANYLSGATVTVHHGEQTFPAPAPLIATLNELKKLLNKHKVESNFINYHLNVDQLDYY